MSNTLPCHARELHQHHINPYCEHTKHTNTLARTLHAAIYDSTRNCCCTGDAHETVVTTRAPARQPTNQTKLLTFRAHHCHAKCAHVSDAHRSRARMRTRARVHKALHHKPCARITTVHVRSRACVCIVRARCTQCMPKTYDTRGHPKKADHRKPFASRLVSTPRLIIVVVPQPSRASERERERERVSKVCT